jgi:hypothetical protein
MKEFSKARVGNTAVASEVLGAAEFRGIHGYRFERPLHGLVAGPHCWDIFGGVGRKAKQTGLGECLHREVQAGPCIHGDGESLLDEDIDGCRDAGGVLCQTDEFAFLLICEARLNQAPVVDAFYIRIETEEFHSTGRQDDSFARSQLNPASIAVDLDAAFQYRDKKIHILSACLMPSAWQINGASKHVEIAPA